MPRLLSLCAGLLFVALGCSGAFAPAPGPTVTLRAKLAGATPAETDTLLAEPLALQLAGLRQLEAIESLADAGQATLTLSFASGTDEFLARHAILEASDQSNLPEGASVHLMSADPAAVVTIALQGDLSPSEMWLAAERDRAALQRLPGVGSVVQFGVGQQQIWVIPDMDRLSAHGLGTDDLMRLGEGTNSLVSEAAALTSLEDIEAFLVQDTVAIRDVAEVRLALSRAPIARVNGQPAVLLRVGLHDAIDTSVLTEAITSPGLSATLLSEPTLTAQAWSYDADLVQDLGELLEDGEVWTLTEDGTEADPTQELRLWSTSDRVAELRRRLAESPDAEFLVSDPQSERHRLWVSGSSHDDVADVITTLERTLPGTPGLLHARRMGRSTPTVTVRPNRDAAARLGTTMAEVADAIAVAKSGREVGRVYVDGLGIPLIIRTEQPSLRALGSVRVNDVPLDMLASIEVGITRPRMRRNHRPAAALDLVVKAGELESIRTSLALEHLPDGATIEIEETIQNK